MNLEESYLFAGGNPISEEDPFGLEPGYGNPVSGPLGPIGPSNPFAQGGAFYTPVPVPQPTMGDYFLGGVVIGGAGVAAVMLAAPAAVASLTAIGVSSATATATVTTTLGVAGAVGGGLTVGSTFGSAMNGNWNAVAFNLGTFGGSAFFGGLGGGRFIADNVSPTSSTVPYSWNPITADNGYGFNRNSNLPLGQDLWNWLGTGPTPTSGGTSALGISSGTSLMLPLSGTSSSQSSATGK